MNRAIEYLSSLSFGTLPLLLLLCRVGFSLFLLSLLFSPPLLLLPHLLVLLPHPLLPMFFNLFGCFGRRGSELWCPLSDPGLLHTTPSRRWCSYSNVPPFQVRGRRDLLILCVVSWQACPCPSFAAVRESRCVLLLQGNGTEWSVVLWQRQTKLLVSQG